MVGLRIVGFFKGDELGAPFLVATMVMEDLGIKSPLEFLIDTGASRTTISDKDAIRLDIDYSKLEKHLEGTLGIGGIVKTFIIRDVKLVFATEDGKLHEEELEKVYVLKHEKPSEKILRIPSILRRDFLNKYKVGLDRKRGVVMITDETLKL